MLKHDKESFFNSLPVKSLVLFHAQEFSGHISVILCKTSLIANPFRLLISGDFSQVVFFYNLQYRLIGAAEC